MSIIGKIGHAFKVFFQTIFGKKGLSALGQATKELLKSELGKIAWAAVNAAASLKDGEASRRQAFNSIKSQAAAAGINVKDSAINLTIELLVQRLKGTFGEVK